MTKSDIYERHSDIAYNGAAFSRATKKAQKRNRKGETDWVSIFTIPTVSTIQY